MIRSSGADDDSSEARREPGWLVAKVRELMIAAGVERKDVNAVQPDDDLHEAGLIHSLLILRLLVDIEKRFRIKIANGDFDLANFQTLNRIAEMIGRYLRGGSPTP